MPSLLLVLALVRVGGEVAHVGDVHDALDVVAGVAQINFKNILLSFKNLAYLRLGFGHSDKFPKLASRE